MSTAGLPGWGAAAQCAALVVFAVTPLAAAVDGIVTNATTGKPQPGVSVHLIQPSTGGMDPVGTATTDRQGRFRIDKAADGMTLLQAVYEDVPYTKMIQPGSPTTGVPVEVFEATKDPATARVSQHIVFLQPGESQLTVNEVYFLKNDTNKTYQNPAGGAFRFYVPVPNAKAGDVRVTINAPGGMPIQRAAEAAPGRGVFQVDYPVKPGETEFDLAYAMPAASEFASKSIQKDVDVRFAVPIGITLEGDGLKPMGNDPDGKVTIYSMAGAGYRVKINGTVGAAPAAGSDEDDTGQPRIEQTNPRVYGELPLVVGLASAVLLLGFVILYRAGGVRGRAAK